MQYELGILGAGQMAEAIVRGILKSKLIPAERIIAADPVDQRRAVFAQLGIAVTSDNATAAKDAGMLLLATKPYQLAEVLTALAPVIPPETLIISIAAGISTQSIETWLGKNRKIIRTMPNTPMLIGAGAVAIAPNHAAAKEDVAAARKIFEAAALVVEVEEKQIDAVTAVSGSGPAYFFYLVECMVDAGVKLGLDPDIARRLAIQTCFGAGKLLSESPDSPPELRRKVTTPNGTTHAAITSMQNSGFPEIISKALQAAHRRAIELGQTSGK